MATELTTTEEKQIRRGADCLADWLKVQGITTIFQLSGGMIMQIIDSLHLAGGFSIVTVQHEQAAAFAAEAIGKLSGRPGLAVATSGPGAINLLTGVGSAFFDSSPAMFITGQVNRHERKNELPIRQLGFQETDVLTMAGPITKKTFEVSTFEDLLPILNTALETSMGGRPGSVLIDLPMDISRATVNSYEEPTRIERPLGPSASAAAIARILELRKQSQKPLILAGSGVRGSHSAEILAEVATRLDIPVVWSLLAVDCLPSEHPHNVGMIGTYGNRWANIALSEADFLLVLGSRLDIRQTGADTKSFKGGRPIVHVDIDSGEINARIHGCEPICADVRQVLDALNEAETSGIQPCTDWKNSIRQLRSEWPDTKELEGRIDGINPNHLMHVLSASGQAAAYCVDVGQHQMWAAQSIKIHEGQRFLTSGGMGAMGYALPAGIGAACHYNSKKPIVVIAGDAGFQLNIQELQTVKRNNLPIKIVIVNNRAHGMTRQFQDSYFGSRYEATVWGYDTPDFAKVAEAFGIKGLSVSDPDKLNAAITELWKDPLAPALVEVMIDTHANAYPKMAFGLPISEMEPFAKPIAMEGT